MVDEISVKPLTEKQLLDYEKLKLKPNLTIKQEGKFLFYNKKEDSEKLRDTILGRGAKSMLNEVYIREKYNKQTIFFSKDYNIGALNGTLSEYRSLELVANFTGERFKVNKDLISNQHIKGKIDAYTGKSIKNATKVVEIKTASSMSTLISLINQEELKTKYYWQLMGYLLLTKAEIAEIYHVLVTYDSNIINESVNRYLSKVRGMGLPKQDIDKEIENIRFNLTFDEIPVTQRIVKFSVTRNEADINRIKTKVLSARKYLVEFDKAYTSMNT